MLQARGPHGSRVRHPRRGRSGARHCSRPCSFARCVVVCSVFACKPSLPTCVIVCLCLMRTARISAHFRCRTSATAASAERLNLTTTMIETLLNLVSPLQGEQGQQMQPTSLLSAQTRRLHEVQRWCRTVRVIRRCGCTLVLRQVPRVDVAQLMLTYLRRTRLI